VKQAEAEAEEQAKKLLDQETSGKAGNADSKADVEALKGLA